MQGAVTQANEPSQWIKDPTRPEKAAPTAHQLLSNAAAHMQDRAATYDKPEGERSMVATVTAFNAVTGHNLTEAHGWLT